MDLSNDESTKTKEFADLKELKEDFPTFDINYKYLSKITPRKCKTLE